MKLDSAGNHVWSRQFALTTSFGTGGAIAGLLPEPSGEMTVVGSFRGRADFGTGVLTTSDAHSRLFVARMSMDTGSTVSMRAFPESGFLSPWRTARCPSGHVAHIGQLVGSADFATKSLPTRTQESGYLLVLDASGNAVSATLIADVGEPAAAASESVSYAVTCIANASGEDLVLVAGGGKGTLRFDDHLRVSKDYEGFVAAYGADGKLRWVLEDASTVGSFTHSITAHGSSATALVGGAGWTGVIEIAPDGSVSWGRKIVDANGPVDLLRAPTDHLLVGGYFYGTLDFGVDPLASAGTTPETLDGFVAKLSP